MIIKSNVTSRHSLYGHGSFAPGFGKYDKSSAVYYSLLLYHPANPEDNIY